MGTFHGQLDAPLSKTCVDRRYCGDGFPGYVPVRFVLQVVFGLSVMSTFLEEEFFPCSLLDYLSMCPKVGHSCKGVF